MAKGKITRFEQSHLLAQCFQKLSAAEASESVYMRERDTTSIPITDLPTLCNGVSTIIQSYRDDQLTFVAFSHQYTTQQSFQATGCFYT